MKSFLLISFILQFSVSLRAQNATLAWAKMFSGQGTELVGNSIATDAAGNVYTTGYFIGAVDFDPGPGGFILQGIHDIFVTKQNAAGDLVWAKQIKGTSPASFGIGSSIAVDAAGNVYLDGIFYSSFDFDPGTGVYPLSSPDTTFFITKLDAAGNFAWAEQMHGKGYPSDHGMAVDPAGNIYLTGSFSGTVDFDPGPGVFNLSTFDNQSTGIVVEKLTSNGDFIWAKQIGGKTGTDNGEANSIAVDATGNIYTTGGFSGVTDFDPGPAVFNLTAAGKSTSILKLDGSGNFIWAKQFNGEAFSFDNRSLAVDAAGNVYTTGYFTGVADFDPGPALYNLTAPNVYWIFCAKLDAAGNFVWARGMGGAGFATGWSVATDLAGNAYLTGVFSNNIVFSPGICELNFTAAGNGDIYIARINADGEFAWVKQLAGESYNAGQSIAVDPAGDIYTTGFFEETVDFDPGPGIYSVQSKGNDAAFIQKMSPCKNSSFSSQTISACGSYSLNCRTYTSSGVYTQVIPNAAGCDSIVTLYLTINNSVALTSINAEACNKYLWNGLSLTQSGVFKDTLVAASGCDSIVTLNLIVLTGTSSNITKTICSDQSFEGYTSEGTYVDTLTAANGCDSIRTIHLSVQQKQAADLGNIKTICPGESMILYPGEFDNYTWQDGSTDSHFTINGPGIYSVNVSSQCGVGQAEIVITEKVCNTLFPSAFTPNRDGKNETFRMLNAPVLSDFDLTVFNRWGQKIFETRNYTHGWDGTVRGQLSETGVYVWFCNFRKSGDSKDTTMKGTVVLIR